MNEENQSVEMQEVAEPAEVSENKVEVAEQPEVVTNEQNQMVKETTQNTAYNKAFAQMRRNAERLEKENQMFTDALKKFGFAGNNSQEILDAINAHYYGKTVEEIRDERIASEKTAQEQNAILERLKHYEEKEIEEKMASDLAEIQKINPTVKSLEELGQPFFDLVSKGVDGVQAYKLLNLEGLITQQNIKVEQDVIKKMRANANSSVGALDSMIAKQKSVADMTDAEFEAYRERALRGELKSY